MTAERLIDLMVPETGTAASPDLRAGSAQAHGLVLIRAEELGLIAHVGIGDSLARQVPDVARLAWRHDVLPDDALPAHLERLHVRAAVLLRRPTEARRLRARREQRIGEVVEAVEVEVLGWLPAPGARIRRPEARRFRPAAVAASESQLGKRSAAGEQRDRVVQALHHQLVTMAAEVIAGEMLGDARA